MNSQTFPVYRKLDGFNRFYKIESPDLFIEASIQQGKLLLQPIHAVQFPEKLRIRDMVSCNFNYVEMNEEEIETYFSF
ncbi:hypothetical protein D3C87_40440 [compost metagenome]